ncbi:MAG TPA: RtcB family protein [Patescibacteria group bacterium]
MPRLELKKITNNIWQLPRHEDMLVPGLIYGNQEIIDLLLADLDKPEKQWNSLLQIYNVACLPGIQKYMLAMSDVHPGYGFPIGGVAAFDLDSGIISVAGVGFDINCGVRTLTTQMTRADLTDEKKEKLANQLYRDIPAGVGVDGHIKLKPEEMDQVLTEGARFSIQKGYGTEEDLKYIEENGRIANAKPKNVSDKAKKRGLKQIGTLGSGNHYLEVQSVEKIFDKQAAEAFGLFQDQLLITIHCGSRGLGHQIGSDYLKTLELASKKYKIPIRERELVCAPFKSPEGQAYYTAVNCGINSAFANRQAIAHLTREAFSHALGIKPATIHTLYEVAHNTVKVEQHLVDGKKKKLVVHRKGATRAFGPGHPEIPKKYQPVGQPVLIGGSMGTYSYILNGTEKAMTDTWGSACHGAGRSMSRAEAKRTWRGTELVKELAERGILIKSRSMSGVAEEAPGSYKDVDVVVDVMHNAGIVNKVVRVRPVITVKG